MRNAERSDPFSQRCGRERSDRPPLVEHPSSNTHRRPPIVDHPSSSTHRRPPLVDHPSSSTPSSSGGCRATPASPSLSLTLSLARSLPGPRRDARGDSAVLQDGERVPRPGRSHGRRVPGRPSLARRRRPTAARVCRHAAQGLHLAGTLWGEQRGAEQRPIVHPTGSSHPPIHNPPHTSLITPHS